MGDPSILSYVAGTVNPDGRPIVQGLNEPFTQPVSRPNSPGVIVLASSELVPQLSFAGYPCPRIATTTRPAPAVRSARADSCAVLPVVITSSAKSTDFPRTSAARVTRNTPRTLSRRLDRAIDVCLGV